MSRDYFTKQRGGYVNDDVCVTLFHLSPNVVTLWSLLHLRPNVITFRSLLHLRPNVITFRSLLHLRSVITFRSSTKACISTAKLCFNANISSAFQVIQKLYAHFTRLCLAGFCKFLGDFWECLEEIVFLKG